MKERAKKKGKDKKKKKVVSQANWNQRHHVYRFSCFTKPASPPVADCKIVPPNISEEFSSGDLVCADCGLVLGDRIVDTRSEWRTFANDEGDDPSRVGSAANPLLNGPQLDTVISQRDGGSGAARELNRTHGRVTAVKGERNLLQAYKDISAMSEAIGLPKLIGR